MSYRLVKDNKSLYIEYDIHNPPLRIYEIGMTEQNENILLGTVVYLNQKEKVLDNFRIKLEELLKASLTGSRLNKVQDEVARLLGYPDAWGFAKEKI